MPHLANTTKLLVNQQEHHPCQIELPLVSISLMSAFPDNEPKMPGKCNGFFMVFIQVKFPTCNVDPARNFTLTYQTPESLQWILIFGDAYHRYNELNDHHADSGCWIRVLSEPWMLILQPVASYVNLIVYFRFKPAVGQRPYADRWRLGPLNARCFARR